MVADSKERSLVFFSKKLKPAETRYAAVEKECLAIVPALQNFQTYLLGRVFTIETDHRALHKVLSPEGGGVLEMATPNKGVT